MQVERRNHPRFRIKDNAFTVINPDPVKLVPILDIGMGGLGIYVNDGGRQLSEASRLEIMVADCSFYLENLPFQIISNAKAFPTHSANIINGGRYGLKFVNLRTAQKSDLKFFIRTYTERGKISQFTQAISKLLHPVWARKNSEQSCSMRMWQNLHRPTL